MGRFAQIWRIRPRVIASLWRRVVVRCSPVVDDFSGFCSSGHAGWSVNAIFLKWSLDLYEYKGLGRDPLKLLVARGSAWLGLWTWIFQVWYIESHWRFLWVEFCEILSEVSEIRKRWRQALVAILVHSKGGYSDNILTTQTGSGCKVTIEYFC